MTSSASRRRSVPSLLVRPAAVVTLVLAGASLHVQAQEFTGFGRTYSATHDVAAICGPSTDTPAPSALTSARSYVAVNSAHFNGASRACGRCVRVRWWSNATETLPVTSQCADCGVADLGLSTDVYSRAMAMIDAGVQLDAMAIKWQFTNCPEQQHATTATENSTAPDATPMATPYNVSANVTTIPSPTYQTPTATKIAIQDPYNAANSTTTGPTVPPANDSTPALHSNTTSSLSNSNSTGSAACSPPDARNGADRAELASYTLLCEESTPTTAPPTPTTAPPASTTTPAPTKSPSPSSSNKAALSPVVSFANSDSDANNGSGTLVVVAKSLKVDKVVASSPAATATATATQAKETTQVTAEEASAKSTQFSSINAMKETAASVAPDSISSPATASQRKRAPLPADDEEEYASSTDSSVPSDSKKKSGADNTTSNSRMPDDSTLSNKRHEALLKNPFFLSSVLLAVVGVVGAVVTYRAKEHRQHRHVHQNVAWHQYSQRVQSASIRSALGTPSPGGLGDAYIVSNTTRHGSNISSSIVVTSSVVAAVLSPTPLKSVTTRAQLGVV